MQPDQTTGRSLLLTKRRAAMLVIAGISLGVVMSAHASPLVNGLYVFVAGEAARASEINHNFAQLAHADLAADERADALEAQAATLVSTQRADGLEARIAALEAKLNRVPVALSQGSRFNVPKTGSVLGSATCPTGTRPISGFIKVSHPYCSAMQEGYIDGNSWRVTVKQAFCLESYHGGIDVDIWAVCIPEP